MRKMTEKLIKDGSETRRAKRNLASTLVGAALLLIGFVCFLIKTFSTEYVDETGLLHEHFFLIPVGFLFRLRGDCDRGHRRLFAVKKHRENKNGD